MVDTAHQISALYNLVNVPSAVWIDEQGKVLRIDEGTYATTHKMGEFEFGRSDYAPMVADWARKGAASSYAKNVKPVMLQAKTADAAQAEAAFRLGVYLKQQGDTAAAERYWAMAQRLNPDSWNYHRQDWAYTPDEAGSNWQKKAQALGDKPYYQPIEGLDKQQ